MTDKDMLAGLVRGLELAERNDGHWIATDELGVHYAITEYKGMDRPFKLEGRGGFFFQTDYHPTLEAAQSAAQADYTARILAALDLDALATRANSAQVDTAALVGAAYGAAAGKARRYVHRHDDSAEQAIRALTPADAQAALDAALKKARREGLEMALEANRLAREQVINSGERARIEGISLGHDRADAAIRKLGGGE